MPDRRGVLTVFICIRKICVLEVRTKWKKTNFCIWYNEKSAI